MDKMDNNIVGLIQEIIKTADEMDNLGFDKIAVGLDSIGRSILIDEFDKDLIKRTAGEKISFKEWEVHHESLKGNDWALNVSRGEEDEKKNPVLVKIQNGVMTVRHKKGLYKSGIQFQSEYFYSDRFKNSVARMFRGLVTGKVSFTSVEEMYDLEKIKDVKIKDKAKEKDERDINDPEDKVQDIKNKVVDSFDGKDKPQINQLEKKKEIAPMPDESAMMTTPGLF